MKTVHVEPTPLLMGNKQVGIICCFHIENLYITLGERADMNIIFTDSEGRVIGVRPHTIEGEIYEGWGKDDQYLVDHLLYEFELTKQQPEPDEEE